MNDTPTRWNLDPQLVRDTVPIGELTLSRALLMNDANYPWIILVPRRPGAVEIIDLDVGELDQLMDEITLVSRVLKDVTRCDKLNVAAIGNVVAQLHVHIVARRRGDAAWPRPVWGAGAPRAYDPAARDQLIAAVRGEIAFE